MLGFELVDNCVFPDYKMGYLLLTMCEIDVCELGGVLGFCAV